MKDMDTSILNTLSLIAPDLMEEMELRTLILERVAALEPIGRRALAARLHLAEREVRAAAEALKRAGCLTQSASGMELTPQGQSLVEAARTVSSGRRTLSGIELSLSQMLGVERVCVVHGDADIDSGVMEEVARAAASARRRTRWPSALRRSWAATIVFCTCRTGFRKRRRTSWRACRRCASRWNWCVMRMCCFTESDGRWIWLSGAA